MKRFVPFAFLAAILILSTAVFSEVPTSANNQPATIKHVFGVDGLSCPFCVIGIQKTFKKIKGVQSVDANLKDATVTVYTDKDICFSPVELKGIFKKTGFSYHGTLEQPKACGNVSHE